MEACLRNLLRPAAMYSFLTGLISAIVGFFAECMVIDMVNDVVLTGSLINLIKALKL